MARASCPGRGEAHRFGSKQISLEEDWDLLSHEIALLRDHFGAVRWICCGVISCLGGAPQTLCQMILYAYSLLPIVLILCLPNFEACLVGSEEDVQEISAAEWRTQVPNQVVHIGEFETSLPSFCV